MEKIYKIYGLYSTKDNVIRYVGYTKNSLSLRLSEHKHDGLKSNSKNHKTNWIKSVYDDGYEIGIKIIEETDLEHWQDREVYWINELKSSNNLVNELKGGNTGGKGASIQNYIDYNTAKSILKKYRFKSQTHFFDYVKKHKNELRNLNIPFSPVDVYRQRGTWISWMDFLSSDTFDSVKRHNGFLCYSELQKFVQQHKLETLKMYQAYLRNNNDNRFPLKPITVYKEYVDYETLYTGKKRPSFELFIRYLRIFFNSISSMNRYRKLYRERLINRRLPFHPERTYHVEWKKIINMLSVC